MQQAVGELVTCRKCERKIFIEHCLIGTNHSIGTIVNCWDCLSKEVQEKAKEMYKLKI